MNDRLVELVVKYLDGEEGGLAPEEGRELNEMLRGDRELRRGLAVMCTHVWMMRETYRPEQVVRPAARGRVRRRVALVAALVIVAVCVSFLVRPSKQGVERVAVAPVAATFGAVSGEVRVTSPGREPRAARPGEGVSSGEGIRLEGQQASAELNYADGTRLRLLGDAVVTIGGGPAKVIEMSKGMLTAVVMPQPAGQAMTLTTPAARLRVVGTEFSVRVDGQGMELRVREGRVEVGRDSESVEVPSGKSVRVVPGVALTLSDIPVTPAVWVMDFEDGLPRGMTDGRVVSEGLPAGSRGGVRAVRVERDAEGVYFNVGSPEMWEEGLFAVYADTHLHVTMKMERPGWLNFFVICRRFEKQGPDSVNYLFDGLAFGQLRPGQWRTVTVPLAQFKRLANVPGAPFENQTPYKLLFSAQEPDRGLVIDKIWVTRGGPGRVTYSDVE